MNKPDPDLDYPKRPNQTRSATQLFRLSEEERLRKFEQRETLYQVGAIFHVVIGARSLFPGSPLLEPTRQLHRRMELNHLKILEKLLELGARVDVHDVAGRQLVV